jgi:predicted ATPase/transcriptional regulator with XRE-family HTH domain
MVSEALSFGQWLKQRRKALDITQEELANRLGCSRTAIQKIETGERRPSRQIAELLIDLFEVSEDERPQFVRYARLNEMPAFSIEDNAGSEEQSHPADVATHTQATPHQPSDLPGGLPAQRRASHSSLPLPLTPLIGREREASDAIELLLRDSVRLLTLVGPMGIGKTRLGIEIAAQLAQHFKDGVCFVGLASVTDPALVPTTIAGAFGLRESGGREAIEALKEYLLDKQLLLFLDNFEQVVEAAPYVVELLTTCPSIKLVLTSREALNVRGEKRFPVPPLALPDLTRTPRAEELLECPSVAFFVERAQEVAPDFKLTNANAEAVAVICHHFDGLPLAIELAAAHSNFLSPQMLLDRLSSRLALVTGGARDLPVRHQTLRNAIGWSYDLLNRGECTLFARLGVFFNGCTLSAVEAVCNPSDDLPAPVPVLLESLVSKSLVRREWSPLGDLRFKMLEIVREYAWERLAEAGELDEIRRSHADYYLAWVEEAESELRGPSQLEWLDRIEQEHDNLRAVLRWSLPLGREDESENEREALAIGLRLAGALYGFWQLRNHMRAGLAWLKALLMVPGERSAERAKALFGAGWLSSILNEYSEARAFLEESLAIRRELDDRRGIAHSLSGLGGLFVDQGEYDVARACHEESLQIRREIGDKAGIASSLNNLAVTAIHQRDYGRAVEVLTEALPMVRDKGDKRLLSVVLGNLGLAYVRLGDYNRAVPPLLESLRLAWDMGYKLGVVHVVEGLSEVACEMGEPRRAATLLGAVEALREQLGAARDPADSADYERTLCAVQQTLSQEDFDAAHGVGRAMSSKEAVDYALDNALPTSILKIGAPSAH